MTIKTLFHAELEFIVDLGAPNWDRAQSGADVALVFQQMGDAAFHADKHSITTSYAGGVGARRLVKLSCETGVESIAREIEREWIALVERHQLQIIPAPELAMEDHERFRRPTLSSFDHPSGEFYRWFEYGGKERPRPLEPDEIANYMRRAGVRGADADEEAAASLARDGDKELWRQFELPRSAPAVQRVAPDGLRFTQALRTRLEEGWERDDWRMVPPRGSDADLVRWLLHFATADSGSDPLEARRKGAEPLSAWSRKELLEAMATWPEIHAIVDELRALSAQNMSGMQAEAFERSMQFVADAVGTLPEFAGERNPYAESTTAHREAVAAYEREVEEARPTP